MKPMPASPTGDVKRSADEDDWGKLATKARRGARARCDSQIDDMIMEVTREEHDVVAAPECEEDTDEHMKANL